MTPWQAFQLGFLYIWFGFSLAAIGAMFLTIGYYHRRAEEAEAQLVSTRSTLVTKQILDATQRKS